MAVVGGSPRGPLLLGAGPEGQVGLESQDGPDPLGLGFIVAPSRREYSLCV